MAACHTNPFLAPGVLIPVAAVAPVAREDEAGVTPAEVCDYCGSASLEWRKCKLICANCRQINKSCADL
jgi:hypothetical protein